MITISSSSSMDTTAASFSDADLVRNCLASGEGAFTEIVARYQTLVCSVTYNASGSLSRSEDLAQEVFVTAWKELRHLREPEKLRSWLCGIARRLTANMRRRDGREPAHAANELEDEHQSTEPGPAEQTISREEEAILWRSLEQIPENYREPLILFYREGKSVEHVAAALELTEDNARQRLSRGRKLLQEQVALFVEGALRQSTPGRAFTLGVIAALPFITASASAATLGTAAVKGGAVVTGASTAGFLGIMLGPIIGVVGAWIGIKAGIESAGSDRERRLLRRFAIQMVLLSVAFATVLLVSVSFQRAIWKNALTAAIILNAALPLTYGVVLTTLAIRFRRAHARLQTDDAQLAGPEVAAQRAAVWSTFEYKSPATFLGLPLLHVRTGRTHDQPLIPAKCWVAIGDVSYGVLLSIGGVAFGGISIGGASVGIVSLGGGAVGVLAFGGMALGLWGAIGGMAIGYLAHGGGALAWHAASGGTAIAHDFAVGGLARAAEANTAVAKAALDTMGFFRYAPETLRGSTLFGVMVLPMSLVLFQAIRAQQALKRWKRGKGINDEF